MKILAYSLLILGFVLIALGRPSSGHSNFPMMIIGAGTTIVGAILLSRVQLRISRLEAMDKDKAQAEEMPGGFSIRKILAVFIAILGFLSCLAGITCALWQDAIRCLIFGAFLVFCSWLLVRRSRI